MLFGSHLSIAGSLANAVLAAESLGLDCVQIFTKNQRQWSPPPLKDDAIQTWQRETHRVGFDAPIDPAKGAAGGRTVSHASYLINLASPKDDLWQKSIDLMAEELRRCHVLGIPYLVHHPGAFTTSTLDEGLARIAKAYKELFKRTAGYNVVSCLENTAGGGSTIGKSFEHLATLRDMILHETDGGRDNFQSNKKGAQGGVAFCIDTCHAHAAGYDMSTRSKAESVLDELDAVCSHTNIRVLHLNDSVAPAGSCKDRHAHIGEGAIGTPGFAAVLNRPSLANRPMILETPKGERDDGTPWDTVNLNTLRSLIETR